MTPREILAAAGVALYGREWQAPLARDLGPMSPRGRGVPWGREHINRMATGALDVPRWIVPALPRLADLVEGRAHDAADRVRDMVAAQLGMAAE